MGVVACKRRYVGRDSDQRLIDEGSSTSFNGSQLARFTVSTRVSCFAREHVWKNGTIYSIGRDGKTNIGYLVSFDDGSCQFVRDSAEICKRIGGTPWLKAVSHRDLGMLQSSDLRFLDSEKDQMPVVLACVEQQWAEGVQWLMGRDWIFWRRADPSAAIVKGKTAIHAAAQLGAHDILSILLDAKACVNALQQVEDANDDDIMDVDPRLRLYGLITTETHPETALHAAASRLDHKACQLLLEHRAQVNVKGPKDKTPLHLVEDSDASDAQLQLAAVLLRHKADPNTGNADRGYEQTSLLAAAQASNAKLAKLCIESGASLNVKAGGTLGGMTALHLACRKKNTSLVVALLNARADTMVQSDAGKTPADLARANRLSRVADFLDGKTQLPLDDNLEAYFSGQDKGNIFEQVADAEER